MGNLTFLNHSSFFIEDEGNCLLFDPWPSDSLSFNGWKSHPPCFLNQEILVGFINSYIKEHNSEKLGLIISHGHDDHCDDSFLSKLDRNIKIIIPKYENKGFYRRINEKLFENIFETNQLTCFKFANFDIYSYIPYSYSKHDSIFIIKKKDYIFIHANDNSIILDDEFISFIKELKENHKIYYCSQTGIANGFPYCYPQLIKTLGFEGTLKLAKEKTSRSIQLAINNANKIEAEYFLSYAAYTISLPLLKKFSGELNQIIPSPKNLKEMNLNWGKLELLDIVPGDNLNLIKTKITKPFWNKLIDNDKLYDKIKEQHIINLENFESDYINLANSFSNQFNNEQLKNYCKNYLLKFGEYIKNNNITLDENFDETIIQINVKMNFKINLHYPKLLISEKNIMEPNKKISFSKEAAWLLVSGIWNFESLYIGHHADFERNPIEKFNQKLIMELQTFGYIYQKRLLPDKLKLLITREK